MDKKKGTVKKIVKYILQMLVVFIAAKYIPTKKLSFKEVTIIAMVGAISFAILDMYAPSISNGCLNTLSTTMSYKTFMA